MASLILLVLTVLSYGVFTYGDALGDIGHSRDYHVVNDDTAWGNMFNSWNQEHQQRSHRFRRDSLTPSLEEIQKFVEGFKPSFSSVQKTLLKMVKHSAVLTGRLKSASSIQEKLVRKNTTLSKLDDIIGLRLTCQTVDEALRIKSLIEKATQDFTIKELVCYGMCPGSSKYRSSGYRRIHLILVIKETGKPAELQIGTPYCNAWSDWNHDFIYKGPKNISNDKLVANYSLSMAEYFWKLDEDRRVLPPCPQVLFNADALKILRDGVAGDHAQETYEKLGYPPNACYWWNDMKLALPEKQCPKQTVKSSGSLNMSSFLVIVFTISMNRLNHQT